MQSSNPNYQTSHILNVIDVTDMTDTHTKIVTDTTGVDSVDIPNINKISNKMLDTVLDIDRRPISPTHMATNNKPLKDMKNICDVPFCSKHGIRSRFNRSYSTESMSSLAPSSAKRSIIKINSLNMINADRPNHSNTECIKSMQRREMRKAVIFK
jgi:hypothetical protein